MIQKKIIKLLSIISTLEQEKYTIGVCNHITNSLPNIKENVTISPFEGPNYIVEKILPRPSESIFDKAFFLSKLIASL